MNPPNGLLDGVACAAHNHDVLFYRDDEQLVSSVVDFLHAGIRGGSPCLVVATPEHRASFEVALEAAGCDVAGLRASGGYVALDASEILEALKQDGGISRVAFGTLVGDAVARLSASGNPPHVFGEMVALLWHDGLAPLAMELETAWNELMASVAPMKLFCAYPISSLSTGSPDDVALVCELHARVLSGSESTSSPISDRSAELGQLHVELARRDLELTEAYSRLKSIDRGSEPLHARGLEMGEALRFSEERFRSLVQNSRDVIAIIGAHGTCSYVSPGVEQLAGYTAEDIIGRSGFEFIHPDDLEMVGRELTAIIAEPGLSNSIEARLRTKWGAWMWIEFRAANHLDDPVIQGVVLNYHGIDDRKAAETRMAQLLAREQEMAQSIRLLLDSTGEGIFGLDTEGNCTFINRSAALMLGGTPDQFIGQHMHSLSHHSHEDGSPYPLGDCPIYAAFRTGVARSVEAEVFWRLDGTSFPVEYSSFPLGEVGSSAGAVLNFRDVTERQRMEKEVRVSESLFKDAFSAARTGITLIDRDGKTYVDVNQAFCEMLGYTRDELMQLTWHDITHPDDLEENLILVAGMVAGGSAVSDVHKRYVRKDGSVISVEITDALVRDDSGAPLYFVTHVIDVTAKEAAARALRESEALLYAVVNNSPAQIYIKDRTGKYLLVNQTALASCGLDESQVLGHTLAEFQPAEVVQPLQEQDDHVFASLLPIEAQDVVPNGDGEDRTYLTVKFPLFDSEGRCNALCGISTDITDRTRALAEREKLEIQLQQSQKMEAVGQLAGGIAHDFNNLLAVILNYADFLREDLDPGDPRVEDVKEISKAGDKAAGLVHQLLAFSRKEVIEPTLEDVNEVIKGLEQLLIRSIGEDIQLRFEGHPTLPPVRADRGQLEQVLMNLAVNARDAMPGGGSLTIVTGVQTLASGERDLPAGEYVVLRVSDTGSGMTAELLERIFEPFFTTKERFEGTGLGLSTVYGIAKQAGGNVHVASAPGAGATFTVHLPVADGDVAVDVTHCATRVVDRCGVIAAR